MNDDNGMVVSNALASLLELSDYYNKDLLCLNPVLINKLLTSMNECSEWGQIIIMDALSKYIPSEANEIEN